MRTLARSLRLWLVAASLSASLWLAPAASAVTIDWVPVGGPGNACDGPLPAPDCYGAVAEAYQISKYEVTNAQYAEFLNAVGAGVSDPLALYSANMDPVAGLNGGITLSSGVYTAVTGRENLPVNHVSIYAAMRFANWLNNGQGAVDTETGAYTLIGGTPEPTLGVAVVRNVGADIFLPSENEWYKAAYYEVVSTSYFDYPAESNTPTVCTGPGATANTANCDYPLGGGPGDLTGVGSYTGSESPNGTFDQGGNVWEWTEALNGTNRVLRGGSLISVPSHLAAATRSAANGADELFEIGFRVASPIPEPGTGLLVMTGVLGLAGWRRRRA